MITVKRKDGFIVFRTQDDGLLPEVREQFADEEFTIETGATTTGGPLASNMRDRSREIAIRAVKRRRQAIENQIDAAANVAQIKQAMKTMMDFLLRVMAHV